MHRMASLTAALLLTGSGLAGALADAVPDLPDATLFRLNPAQSALNFEVSKMGFLSEKGRFDDVEATIFTADGSPETIRMHTVIDVASIDLSSEEKRQWLLGEDWFDAAAYPQATFECAAVEMTGETSGVAEGDLTIRGITHPATFVISFHEDALAALAEGDSLSFDASGEFSRSAFGMTKMSALVGDRVVLDFSGQFDRMPASVIADRATASPE